MRNPVSWRWNGRQGRDMRHDVIVWYDGRTWQVEDRHGGETGWATIITAIDEDDAWAIAANLARAAAGWHTFGGPA